MNKHTPEPWDVDDPSWIEVNDITVWKREDGKDPWCVAQMGSPIMECGNREEAELSYANACRIVACVNACKGINPKAVPKMREALHTIARVAFQSSASPLTVGRIWDIATAAISFAEKTDD